MDDGEGGRAALDVDEKSFLFEWLVENNKTLTRKNKELLVENLKLRSRVEELEKINFVDPTTGLHNRWYLQARLEEEFSRARRAGSSLSCLFIDIDHFKAVNERYGHFIGDKVLRDMANLLRGLCRREDVLVRFGTDEFVILLGSAGQRAAKTAAERIRGRLEAQSFNCGEQEITLSVGIGVSILKKQHVAASRDPWELVWTADGAMCVAKKKGPGEIYLLDCHGQGPKPAESERAVS
jgi:two-component system, cell cycle response regulator